MVRGLPPRNLALSDLRKLKKKVNKNSKQLARKELGRIRINMDSTPDTTAVVQNVSFVAQGDDVVQRHGRKIHAEHVAIQGNIIKHTASISNGVRMILFRDNLGSTTPPTLGDVFGDEENFFSNQIRSINEMPTKRFTILWDKYIVLNENFDGQTTMASYKFSKKLNFDILYTGTAATDEGKNSLWFMSGSDEATNVPIVLGSIVFKYSDL